MVLMKDEIVSIETSKLAKEKNFNYYSDCYYCEYISDYIYDEDINHPESHKKGEIKLYDGIFQNNSDSDFSNENYIMYGCPTQSRLQKWIRNERNVLVEIFLNRNTYCFVIKQIHYKKNKEKFYIETIMCKQTDTKIYEEALEEGLQTSLSYILNH